MEVQSDQVYFSYPGGGKQDCLLTFANENMPVKYGQQYTSGYFQEKGCATFSWYWIILTTWPAIVNQDANVPPDKGDVPRCTFCATKS